MFLLTKNLRSRRLYGRTNGRMDINILIRQVYFYIGNAFIYPFGFITPTIKIFNSNKIYLNVKKTKFFLAYQYKLGNRIIKFKKKSMYAFIATEFEAFIWTHGRTWPD